MNGTDYEDGFSSYDYFILDSEYLNWSINTSSVTYPCIDSTFLQLSIARFVG